MLSQVAHLIKGVGLYALPQGNYTNGMFTLTLERPLAETRGGTGAAAGMRCMPRLEDYVLDK